MSDDQTFRASTRIRRPADEVFAWHERRGALARLCPPWERVRIVAATGGVRDGARVTVQNRIGPIWTEWQVEHRDYIAGRQFRDVQLSGPFAKWEHLHRVEPDGSDACLLTDEITYRLPGGPIGAALGGRLSRSTIARLFAWRHAVTKGDLELARPIGSDRPQRIVVAGASGLIGSALIPFLQTQGHTVVRLVRGKVAGNDELVWDPAKRRLDFSALDGVDVVVNLSGANVGAGRWTAKRRDAIRRSRLDATETLVEAIGRASRKPRVFVTASAVGLYGNRGDEVLSERSSPGAGFLADVCGEWEARAAVAEQLGVRTAIMRLGVVLSPAGGALGKLVPVFRAGVGGRVGDGNQWMSWASIDDVVGAFYHVMAHEGARGPLNVVAPHAVTNAEFAKTLGRVLRRPAVCPVPATALRIAFGEMADATLLASTRVVPDRLHETAYEFRHPMLEAALRHVLGRLEI